MSVPVPPRPMAECMHPSANHPGAAMARHAARPTIACVAAANRQRKGWLPSLRASQSQLLRLCGQLGADFPLCPSCLARHPRLELRATTHGRPWVLAPWRGGRVVDCTALEMRHGCKPIGGSNPPLSASQIDRPLKAIAFCRPFCTRGWYTWLYPCLVLGSTRQRRLLFPARRAGRSPRVCSANAKGGLASVPEIQSRQSVSTP